MRTDIMYRRQNPVCDTPCDREAYRLFREAELMEGEGRAAEAAVLFRRSFKMSPDLAKIM